VFFLCLGGGGGGGANYLTSRRVTVFLLDITEGILLLRKRLSELLKLSLRQTDIEALTFPGSTRLYRVDIIIYMYLEERLISYSKT